MNATNKVNLIVLSIISLLVLSACTSSAGHQAAASVNQIQTQADTGIRKGQVPPDFIISTIDGKQLNLREFKNENKPILLYFWASWCPYCSQDFNVVKDIYPRYAGKVAFLAIDLDLNENAELIKNYKNKKGLAGVDFAEGKESILSDYGIIHTTTKYAIGRDGVILYKGSGVFNEQQWETLLRGLVNS
ncbi:TlpA family protein disulfide reductase [Candidatus Woesearchaeota archaeon]|nr:TlpA family protein disulfide reductase [Candidatus Woesearchaeota archaeon]